ncbi:MAG: hypothetical protein K2O18_06555 [Oscillospiraceae bacterium]|nr:hypothetical protein [Oscillospiraceae bacterium]
MSAAKKMSLQKVMAVSDEVEQSVRMRMFAQQLTDEIYSGPPEASDKLVSLLIAELALSGAEQRKGLERRKFQRERVAAAQARGVRFGRKNKPLPDNFEEYYQSWKDGQLSLTAAAEFCGMSRQTFRRAVQRVEEGHSQQ